MAAAHQTLLPSISPTEEEEFQGGEGLGEGENFFFKIPANVRAVQAQVAHTPCPATRLLHPGIHPESSVHCNCTCNRGSAKIGCTVLCGSPPYPFLASKPNRIRCSTRLACFFGQRAIRRGLLPRLVYPVVFIRGFHHRTCLMQACAQMRNRMRNRTCHHRTSCAHMRNRTCHHRTSCAYCSGKCAHCVSVRRAPVGYTLSSAA